MKSKEEIAEQFKKHKDQTDKGLSRQRGNIRKCRAFYDGDYMDYSDKVQFSTPDGKKRATVKFNKIKPYVTACHGFMIQNRRKINYSARTESQVAQVAYSTYTNALSDFVRENANADQMESAATLEMLIGGVGITDTAVTYGQGYVSTDPNGEVIIGPVDIDSAGWDPTARLPNVIEARWKYYKKEYELEEAKALFADAEDEDFEQTSDEPARGEYDFMPRGGTYDRMRVGYDMASVADNMVNVYFYQWYEIEKYYRAYNPLYTLTVPMAVAAAQAKLEIIAADYPDLDPRAEVLTFDADAKSKLVDAFGDMIDPVEMQKKCYYGAVLSGKKVFSRFKLPTQEGYTIQHMTGQYDATNKMWVGMVNSMMEPQKYYDKAVTEIMFIIGANSKGGVMVEEGAVADIQEFSESYAKTDGVVELLAGGLAKIQSKRDPIAMTGYENIVTLADAALVDVTGIDKTFLGSSENRMETGILQRRRIRQVTTLLAGYVDALSLYQKMQGRIMLDFLRIYAENNQGALFRILGRDGAVQYMQISRDKLMAEYEILMGEQLTTPEDREEKAQLLFQVGERLTAAGNVQGAAAAYAVAIKYLGLDPSDKEQLMQAVQPQQGQVDPAYVAQLEAAVQQLQSEQSRVQMDNIAANTELTMKKAAEASINAKLKTAEIAKKVEETEKISAETDLAHRAQDVSVTV